MLLWMMSNRVPKTRWSLIPLSGQQECSANILEFNSILEFNQEMCHDDEQREKGEDRWWYWDAWGEFD